MGWMDSRNSARVGRILAVAALVTVPAWGQTSQPSSAPTPASESNFTVIPVTPGPSEPPPQPALTQQHLRVTGDNVNLRTRPDVNSLPVAKLPRDTVLVASGSESGWRRVSPPSGVFVVVAGQYVRRESPTRGVVETSSGALRVRAASLIMPIDPNKCDVVTRLQPGTVVDIVGEQGEWLRILPPAEVQYYVNESFVEPISSDTANTLSAGATPLSPSQMVAEQATLASDAQPLPAPTPAQAEPVAPGAEPLPQPSVVATPGSSTVVTLEGAANPGASAMPARSSGSASGGEASAEPIAKDEEPYVPPARMGFDAQGVLRPSFALPAGPHGLRYKLQDPYTKKVRAYVEIPYELKLDLKKALGAYVGIQGQSYAEETSGAQVYKATSVTILQ